MNFAIVPETGDGEPTFTMRSVCLDCGETVLETTYDVRDAPSPERVAERGVEDGLACVAHWRERHDVRRN